MAGQCVSHALREFVKVASFIFHRFGVIAGMIALTGCATAPRLPSPPAWGKYASEFAGPGGLSYDEARQFIEFCVELDNQDDRDSDKAKPSDFAQVDPTQWRPIYDSRKAIAEDYFKYKALASAATASAKRASLPDDSVEFWKHLFARIEKQARDRKVSLNGPADIEKDPSLNGFGAWQNAWILYQGVGRNAGRYAIAIRGTVFETEPSAIENALFQPVEGPDFLTPVVSFAQSRDATVHSGFAHATFTLLLDRRYGILPVIERHADGVPPGSVLYIVGHSQGAAMATLVHAFLFNAMYDAEVSGADPLGLKGMHYRLKSYAIAQPKPGNYAFSTEFASYTQGPDNAIVINNSLDPVPRVPLTIQSMADLETDFHGKFLLARAVYALGATGKWLRLGIGKILEWNATREAAGYGHFYHWNDLQPLHKLRSGESWEFVPAGRVITVYGTPQPDQSGDEFFQHHATTYRDLISQQLAAAP